MKKTLVIAIVLVIAASMLLGCKNNRKDIDLKYSFVLILDSGRTKTYVNEELKDHMKEETLFGETIELKYCSSTYHSSTYYSSTNSSDVYRSEDGKYEYRYHNEPGKEERLSIIYAAGLKKAQNLNTEEDCLEMIKDLLSEFGISEEEISRFTLRCETVIEPYVESGYYVDTYDGFKYAEKDGESLVERRFSFERFMGEYQYTAAACPKVIFDYRKMTDDAPTVRVYPGSKYIRDEIDKYDASEIDFTEIERELKIFVKDVTTNEEYTTTSVSIRDKHVRIVDGKLTLVYTTSRNIIYNKTGAEMPSILDTVHVTP
ncbi:MAG: hypothetical protein II748_07585 [Clostridia bacterium]|nr:hypothetical protein [Clostridia bacterium]